MHEGDHNIVGDEHEHAHHDHEHDHKHPHEHRHDPRPESRRPNPSRMIAGVIVAAAVMAFLVWRFL